MNQKGFVRLLINLSDSFGLTIVFSVIVYFTLGYFYPAPTNYTGNTFGITFSGMITLFAAAGFLVITLIFLNIKGDFPWHRKNSSISWIDSCLILILLLAIGWWFNDNYLHAKIYKVGDRIKFHITTQSFP